MKLSKPGKYVWKLDKKNQVEEVAGAFEAKSGEKVVVETDLIMDAIATNGKVHLKGVVYEGGYLEFRGKIKITESGQKADAFLKFEILKLGKNSTAIAVPDLEIATNDVKASHAASVCGINQEQLYYLQSKGVGRSQAEKMLVCAFLR